MQIFQLLVSEVPLFYPKLSNPALHDKVNSRRRYPLRAAARGTVADSPYPRLTPTRALVAHAENGLTLDLEEGELGADFCYLGTRRDLICIYRTSYLVR
jgi:hypothetical protein